MHRGHGGVSTMRRLVVKRPACGADLHIHTEVKLLVLMGGGRVKAEKSVKSHCKERALLAH